MQGHRRQELKFCTLATGRHSSYFLVIKAGQLPQTNRTPMIGTKIKTTQLIKSDASYSLIGSYYSLIYNPNVTPMYVEQAEVDRRPQETFSFSPRSLLLWARLILLPSAVLTFSGVPH